jgi:hypothetical protein
MRELNIEAPEGYIIDKDKSTFEKIVFKEKNKPPMSWEEYLDSKNKCEFEIPGETRLETQSREFKILPKRFKALYKLEKLRDAWNKGWVPDWEKTTMKKQCVFYHGNEPKNESFFSHNQFLAFETREKAVLFMKTFRDLIEDAKPLL